MMAVLELKQVKKTFGSGDKQVEAMKETNFLADRGELIAIIGPSGSGKKHLPYHCGRPSLTNFRRCYHQ